MLSGEDGESIQVFEPFGKQKVRKNCFFLTFWVKRGLDRGINGDDGELRELPAP